MYAEIPTLEIVAALRQQLPDLLAVYLFGSHASGQARLKTSSGKGGYMADDVILNKAASIERCVALAREGYYKDAATFGMDMTRQDAAILNIQRACEAALDIGHHLIRRERLGVPQSARDVFDLLAQASWIDMALANALKRMVGFRNIAVHNYRALQLPITVAIIEKHLDDFLAYSQKIILHDV